MCEFETLAVAKQINQSKQKNFLEVETEQEANLVDMNLYRFERFSETKNKYIFVKRARII